MRISFLFVFTIEVYTVAVVLCMYHVYCILYTLNSQSANYLLLHTTYYLYQFALVTKTSSTVAETDDGTGKSPPFHEFSVRTGKCPRNQVQKCSQHKPKHILLEARALKSTTRCFLLWAHQTYGKIISFLNLVNISETMSNNSNE